jgi:hypothetical protein
VNTRTATLILFACGTLGGTLGWCAASLLAEDFLGMIHLAALMAGTWVGLLAGFLAVTQIARRRRCEQGPARRTGTR